jgi:hypothetical protein
MADLMCVSRRAVYKLEEWPHHCPHAASVMLLRVWLQDSKLKERLERVGYPHPWPEDVKAMAAEP